MRASLRLVLASALATAAPLTARGQATEPPRPPLRIAASSFATVDVHLNARRIGRDW